MNSCRRATDTKSYAVTASGRRIESGGFCEVRVHDITAGQRPGADLIEAGLSEAAGRSRYGDFGRSVGVEWWTQCRQVSCVTPKSQLVGRALSAHGRRSGRVWRPVASAKGRSGRERVVCSQASRPDLVEVSRQWRARDLPYTLMSCRSRLSAGVVLVHDATRRA